MIYLIKYLYLFTFILTCLSSENENVTPMSGFYTDGLDQALDKIEIVYPERVSKDGSFVSYYLPHYYSIESLENRPRRTLDNFEDSSGDAIHFFVPIEGEKHHLELWPNLNFLAPGLVIERRDARDVENINKAKITQISPKQCHYNGRIVGKPESRAALSTCYGLAGYIQLPAGEEYLIEPVKDSKPTYNKEHPHIMYKRSGIKDRHKNSNCLTKGSAKDALGERLQWESIFGNQVRKDFSAMNMNDLVRDYTAKSIQDNLKSVDSMTNTNPADAASRPSADGVGSADSVMGMIPSISKPLAASPQQEPLVKVFENKLDEENAKLIKNLQVNNQRIQNEFEGHVQSNYLPINPLQRDFSTFEKRGKFKPDFGNKLKQKPLREELGSIKLPDINLSQLKIQPNQPIETDPFMNKQGMPSYEKEKRIYETDLESRRIKRDLNEEFDNLDSDLNEDSDMKINGNQQDPLKKCLKIEQNREGKAIDFNEIKNHDSFQASKKMPSMKSLDDDITKNGDQICKSKREAQNNEEDTSSETKETENTDKNLNKDEQSHEYNKILAKRDDENNIQNIGLIHKDANNEVTENANGVVNRKDDVLNKENNPLNDQILNRGLLNNVNHKYSFTNIENNVKRDIHLDTSEKSWQTGENDIKSNSGMKLDQIHKDNYNADTKSEFVDDRSSKHSNLVNTMGIEKQKGSKSSQTLKSRKTNTDNDDEIMVSALESVVRDMDKTKVKKDVLGGLSHPPMEDKSLDKQPLHSFSSAPMKYNDAKFMKVDEAPEVNPSDTKDRDGNTRIFDIGSKEISKESKSLDMIGEPVQVPKAYAEKQSQNHVDEIIIRIKTPEGTVSEVKHNHGADSEGLRNNYNEPVVDIDTINIGVKDSELGNERNKLLTKTNIKPSAAEKNKRGVDNEIKKEGVKQTNNQDIPENYKGDSTQDFNIILEAAQESDVENSNTKIKAKREDNTIHLVIETEPEVKSPEGRNSESPGSNLFCQGKNCLEIKPVFLNDTKAAVTSSNNSNAENSKEKIVEKRDTDGNDEFCGSTTTDTPLRCSDFNHKVFNLEIMITVDYKVVQMHEDDDIENFILTIINMVSSNFDDKSIGLNMNVVLVRLILLTTCIKELDSDRFNPEELLENFCTWQVLVNPGRDDHPHHHDLAIFVSKMDKCEGQVMGVSYMTSVCRPDKACIICIDEGLLLANTITHQIGHSLGADHDDGQSTGCAPSLPDGTTYHMAPTISETSNAWSVCSRDAIIQFVQTQGSWCLLDFPVVRSYNFPLMLPGQIYSAAQQCKLNFHMTAIPCSVGPFCNKLYCQITDKLCATKGDPPADGTFCASNMWCFHKQCVHTGRRPGAINGEWGPWTEWSLCTRSCGGGVSSSYRICNNPKPENGGRYCIGERMRHRICQTKPCQGFTESFRDLQCKRTEDRPFRGKIHNWVQYQSLFINIECALVCQNRKGDVVMRSPIVADGTPCKAGTQNVCIQGICRMVGCDYVIDSNAKEDACGVCHGNGTECRIIQGIFDEPVSKKGLIEFLRIPKDSGMIFVREVAPSPNILVVSGSINRVFYLNGLGSEDSMAGDVAFGVTHGVYEKRGGMERVFIRGPTKEDLIFYVLFRDRNKGIHYQYATLEYDPTYIPRYLWQYLDWDTCSDPCSGGSQRARAKCVEDRGGVVDDKYCTESTRPLDIIRPCNDFPCLAKWWVSVWSDCICTGAASVMFRSVLCMRANDESGTRVEVVKESECSVNKKPPTQKPCNYSEEETDCAKRSIPDDALFQAYKDHWNAVNPRLAFSAFSPEDSDNVVVQDSNLLSKESFDGSNKDSFNESKNLKKSKVQINKNINSKAPSSKQTKPKTVDKDPIDKKKLSPGKLQEADVLKPIELSKIESSEDRKPHLKNEDLPLMESKGRQIAKINQKNSAALTGGLKSAISKEGADDNDIGSKDYEGKGVSDNCETTLASSMCPTEEETYETETTCKQTCAPLAHKRTTCCKTTPHRHYDVKTTMETTTIRPVAIKLDELNVNNFALTVVPLEYSGKKKLLPQSDPEFIHLGNVGQFGVADELNATVISGQEALDLLEFARSNASDEPEILHEDMHK